MKLKITFILFHTLVVLSSTKKANEFSNYGKRLTQLQNMFIATGTLEPTPRSSSRNHCGGKLLGESGVISYKENEKYNDHESCIWIIKVPGALKIGFTLEKTGLEHCCDHVNVTSLDTTGLVLQEPVKLKFYHTVFVDGPNALVRFDSDTSETGLGFRLSYYKITDLNEEIIVNVNSQCGGVIVGETGGIRYELMETYWNNDRCVWLVNSPNSTSITFHLRRAELAKYHDLLLVASIDPETGTLRDDTRMLKEHDDTVTIQESMAVITLNSTGFVRNTLFFLTFSGNGVNTNPKYVYKLRHIAEPTGTIEYPAKVVNDDEITEQQPIYVTAASSKGNRESPGRFISGIDLNEGIFLRANDSSCVYDSLTFYESLVITQDEINVHAWQKKAQIPNDNDTLLCPERVSVPKQRGLLDFEVQSFIAIYKPISKDTLEHSNVAVSFDYYYKPNKCFEIVEPLEDEFAIMFYAQPGIFGKEESCGWIIEVPNATQIDFNLEEATFVSCCDYVAVTSLDMDGRMQGPTQELRIQSIGSTASVTGSRALVNFISDGTKFGPWFSLRYTKIKSLGDTVCGGVLNPMLDDFGVISYKSNENYANGENCQWRIETPGWVRIGFTLEKSGFEECCDFVTISSIPANGMEIDEPVQLRYVNRSTSLTGPSALVRFTSDEMVTGKGFRLRYEKLPALEHHDAQ